MNWGAAAPPVLATAPIDGWAAVGYGRRTLRGLTRFIADHDDGLRLTIGGTVVYDMLTVGPQANNFTVHGTGTYDFMFEQIETVGTAHLDLSWTNYCDIPIQVTSSSWGARYYSVIYDGSANPPTWTLNYDDCRYAEAIATLELDFDWMGSAPAYLVNNYNLLDLWGAEFFGPRFFAPNTIVTLGHDDGLRVFIDGALTYESWTAPQVVTNGSILLSGNHDVFLQYFENAGFAGIHFNY
jgi:hypothetical protein